MPSILTVTRYHDISCGHRVVGHEGKCKGLHGHNYRIHFECQAPALDTLGRVIDFSVIKDKLCMWLEYEWDHKFLMWEQDPFMDVLGDIDGDIGASIWGVPFNPTAENMAGYLLDVIGPLALSGTNVELVSVRVEETRKCSAEARRG